MAVAGSTARRRLVRALLWAAGTLLAMFAVSCLFTSSAEAAPRENPVGDLLDVVENVVTGQKPAESPAPDLAEKPVTPPREKPASKPAKLLAESPGAQHAAENLTDSAPDGLAGIAEKLPVGELLAESEPPDAPELLTEAPVKREEQPDSPVGGLLGDLAEKAADLPVPELAGKPAETVPVGRPAEGKKPGGLSVKVPQVVQPLLDQSTGTVAPLLGRTEKTLGQAGVPVAEVVDALAPVLHLVEQPVANLFQPLGPLLDQVDRTVAAVVKPVTGVVQTLAPVLELLEPPLSLVTGSVSVLGRGLEKTVEPILVPLAEATENPLLPSVITPKCDAHPAPPVTEPPAETAPSPPFVSQQATQQGDFAARAAIAVTEGSQQAFAAAPARTEQASAAPGLPQKSPAQHQVPPAPFAPLPSSGTAGSAGTPHGMAVWPTPDRPNLNAAYVVTRPGDEAPLWRSIKPGSRPD